MQKIKLNKDVTVFECHFKKGQEVEINGKVLMIGDVPVICDSFGKTPKEFMDELIKNN